MTIRINELIIRAEIVESRKKDLDHLANAALEKEQAISRMVREVHENERKRRER